MITCIASMPWRNELFTCVRWLVCMCVRRCKFEFMMLLFCIQCHAYLCNSFKKEILFTLNAYFSHTFISPTHCAFNVTSLSLWHEFYNICAQILDFGYCIKIDNNSKIKICQTNKITNKEAYCKSNSSEHLQPQILIQFLGI